MKHNVSELIENADPMAGEVVWESDEIRNYWKGFVVRIKRPIAINPETDCLRMVVTINDDDQAIVWGIKNNERVTKICVVSSGWDPWHEDEARRVQQVEAMLQEVKTAAIEVLGVIESLIYDAEGKGDSRVNIYPEDRVQQRINRLWKPEIGEYGPSVVMQ